MAELEEVFQKDYLKGYTTIGPHRDDIEFLLDEKDATKYASSGQQRAIVYALKMAEITLYKQYKSQNPVFLLDDIDTELDVERIKRLIKLTGEGIQLIVSTTKPELFKGFNLDLNVIRLANKGVFEIK